ncbi:MAG: tRNA pseudouridine(38-40) synthase TruA [Holosporales bacterium]|jgi:tRNA pseudouridine38-40 synthase|nr:tRNA pseudouridine(38-40) synthase TruA [Holosporales bacterium]
MPRYRAILEYDGTPFCGWQRQRGVLSIQEVFETALAILAFDPVTVFAAGRTDAGVHALGQVVHFDLKKVWDPFCLQAALNFYLRPHPVAILSLAEVSINFHARLQAIERHYRYQIINRRAPLCLDRNRAWHITTPLDVAAMNKAAQYLVGHHDFTTFRAKDCQSLSPVKTIYAIHFTSEDSFITMHIKAPSFLHHQVRNMIGTLVQVGRGTWKPEQVKEALEAKARAAGGPTAPPSGLFFVRVVYPETLFFLPDYNSA